MFKILVCGGRAYSDSLMVREVLNKLALENTNVVIIQGGAKGADRLAQEWAETTRVPCVSHYADWSKYGKSAGHIRNKQMLDFWKPGLVVAFPGGHGTANMTKIARESGVSVMEIFSV